MSASLVFSVCLFKFQRFVIILVSTDLTTLEVVVCSLTNNCCNLNRQISKGSGNRLSKQKDLLLTPVLYSNILQTMFVFSYPQRAQPSILFSWKTILPIIPILDFPPKFSLEPDFIMVHPLPILHFVINFNLDFQVYLWK